MRVTRTVAWTGQQGLGGYRAAKEKQREKIESYKNLINDCDQGPAVACEDGVFPIYSLRPEMCLPVGTVPTVRDITFYFYGMSLCPYNVPTERDRLSGPRIEF